MQAWQDRADDEVARRSDKGVANAVEDRDAILHLIKSGYTFSERALTARDAARGPCFSLEYAGSRKRKISRAISEVSSTLVIKVGWGWVRAVAIWGGGVPGGRREHRRAQRRPRLLNGAEYGGKRPP